MLLNINSFFGPFLLMIASWDQLAIKLLPSCSLYITNMFQVCLFFFIVKLEKLGFALVVSLHLTKRLTSFLRENPLAKSLTLFKAKTVLSWQWISFFLEQIEQKVNWTDSQLIQDYILTVSKPQRSPKLMWKQTEFYSFEDKWTLLAADKKRMFIFTPCRQQSYFENTHTTPNWSWVNEIAFRCRYSRVMLHLTLIS